jgi:hypothetical protein
MIGRRGAVTLGLATLSLLSLSSCRYFYPSEVVHYRVTVDVQTPTGVMTGSSVVESKMSYTEKFGSAFSGIRFDLMGEAVAVDVPIIPAKGAPKDAVPQTKTLFALLRGGGKNASSDGNSYYANLFRDAYVQKASVTVTPPKLTPWLRDNKPKVILPKPLYPLLVTFKDITDPKTVEQVDPDALDKQFGKGVTLKSITVAVTDEPVTTGIEKRLGWLPEYYGKMLDGSELNNLNELANNLSMNSFKQGTSK